MALSIDEYRKMKSENKFFWDTDSLKQTQNDINDYLRGVGNQANGAEMWSDDEFNNQRSQISGLRGRLNALQAYANSVKEQDKSAYDGLMQAHSSLKNGLNEAEKWFNGNTAEVRKQQKLYKAVEAMQGFRSTAAEQAAKYGLDEKEIQDAYDTKRQYEQELNTYKAVEAMKKGNTTAAEQAAKYGLNIEKTQEAYDNNSKYLRAELQKDKYDSLSYDELYGLITNPKSYAEKIADEATNFYTGIGSFDMADEKTKQVAFKSIAKEYGTTAAKVKEIYESSKHPGYTSHVLSEEDADYIIQRLYESGTSAQLEQLKNSHKDDVSNKIFKKISKGLNQAIEDKKEEEYYLSVLEKFPNAEKVINNHYGWESMNQKSPDSVTYREDMSPDISSKEDFEANKKEYQKLVDAGVDTARFHKFEKRYKEHQEALKKNEEWAQLAEEHPVGASLLSIPMNMIGSVGDVVSYAEASRDDGYVDTAGTLNRQAQTIRDTVNKKIDNPVGQFFYSTGMSMGDMALAGGVKAAVKYAIGGPVGAAEEAAVDLIGAAVSGLMYFSSAGVSSANEVIDSGGSYEQAAWTMVTHGAAELVFEEISLEKLSALKASGNVKGIRDVVKNAAKQAFTEGSEEVATSIANAISDGIINGDLSEFERNKRAYTDSGMSEEEANGAAVADFFKGLGTDFLGGAVSGGVMGGSVSTYAAVRNNIAMNNMPVSLGGVELTAKQAKKLAPEYYHELAQELTQSKDFDVNTLIEQAKQGGEKSQKLAESMERTVAKKGAKAITNADVENVLITLYGDNIKARQTGENIESAAAIESIDKAANQSRAESFLEEYLSEFDETGAKKAEGGSTDVKTTRAFGASHPNGLYATENGKQIVITGIESVVKEYGGDGSTVTLKTDDGKKVNAAGVSFNDPDIQRLVNLAPNYDSLGARALLANYEEARNRGLNTDDYIVQSEALYKIGRSGVTFENAVKSPEFSGIINSMGENAAKSFLNAGNNDTEAHVRFNDINLRRVRVPGAKTSARSRVWAESSVEINASPEFMSIMQAIAEVVSKDGKVGRDIVFTDKLSGEDAGVYSNGKIYISAESDEHVMITTALHEAVHKAKVYAPAEYRALEKFVMNYLVANGQDVKTLLDNIAAIWGQDAADVETQREELIAQTVAALASDENAFVKAVQIKENKNLLDKVREALKTIIEHVKKFFRDVDEQGRKYGHNIQAQPWLDDLKALEGLAEKFSEMMTAVRENEAAYGARESEVRHSFTEISDLINETEQEKINRLKNATVEYVVASEKSLAAVSEIDVSDISSQQFEKLVFPLLDKLGAFGTHYNNVYDIEFNYSRKSGSRSLSHQMKISGKNFKANAIVQANLKELCKTAYPVEAHIDEKPKENVHETQKIKEIVTFFNALQVGNDAIFVKMTVKIPQGISNRLHMVVTSEIKKGFNLTLHAKADTEKGAVHLAGKSNPTISIQSILENVKDIDEFKKRLPIESVLETKSVNIIDKGKKSKNDAFYFDDVESLKERQNSIVQQNNSMHDDYHTGIRGVEDIYTFEEALGNGEYEEGEDFTPDYTWRMAQRAVSSGKITVYSSYPIKQGVFVTPSKMEAEGYSGSGRTYKKTVALTDVAWIDALEGQYANVSESGEDMFKGGRKAKNDAWGEGDNGKIYSQNFKEWFGDWLNNPQNASKVVDKNGKPLVVYHQTAADFTVFNTDNPLAGLNDSETPNGIFFKTNDHDIGLQGKKQMPVYLNIRKMLSFTGRPEANRWYRNHIKGYEALDETMKHEIGKIEKKMNIIEDEMFQDISTEEYDRLDQEWNSLLEEMRTVEDEYRGKLRNLLNDYFLNGNSGYDGIHLSYDGHRYVNGNREDVETYIVFKNTQVKSATDNIGTFDKNNPDIRYSKNDTFYFDDDGDLFFGDDNEDFDKADPNDEYGRTFGEIVDDEGGQIDVDRLLTEHPEDAAYRLYQALAKTAGNGLRNYNGVRLDREDYIKAARRVMKRYGILQRNNHGFDSELAERMTAFADEVRNNPKTGFSLFVNALALDCKKYLEERSGDYDRTFLGDIAKQVYSALRGSTLIITPYAESHVLENFGGIKGVRRAFKGYVNVGFEKDIGRYKHPVSMDDVIEEIALATGEHLGTGEHSVLFPDGERPDSLSGWSWLENLLTNVLKPKFVSPYKEGMVESVESAALEMAFDISAEILTEKTSKAAVTHNIDRKTIKELSDTQKKALAERDALHKVKAEKYQEQIDRLRKRLQRERGLKELAQEDLDVLKRFVRSDTKNFRQQYQSNVRAQNDLEAVRRSMNKIRTMIVNPTNEKYIPPEILHNTTFLNAFEALGEAITLNSRSKAAAKMEVMLLQIKALKGESEKRFDGDFETAFDEEFTDQLQKVVDWLKTDTLEDMEEVRRKISRKTFSNDEIGELRQLIDEIVFRIENARKLLGRKDAALAQEASENVIAQTREIDSKKAKKVFAGYAEQMMNPLRVINLMSNYNEDSWLKKLFFEINEGQRKQWFWEMQAEKAFSDLVEKYDEEYKSACNDVIHFDYIAEGKDYHVDMTRMQGLQVLMTWKRESRSRMNHMSRGGIVVADPKKVAKGKGRAWENAQRVAVGSDLITQIIKTMGKFENEYMKTAEHYFNEVAKDAINETFMKTRHREIARSDYYIPVRVDSKFTKAEIQSLKFDFTIEGAGSYKHITPHAPQPILIESLNSVIDRHIKQTGKLYGLDIPLINFKRMLKGTTRASLNGSQAIEWDSVKKALSEKFGDKGVAYIEDTISKIEGGREHKESWVADFLYTTRVNTALIGNLGVVIKQAASYTTAGLYLSAKDLSVGLGKFIGKSFSSKHYSGIIDEIDKHTAQHYIRRKGMSVQEVSDMMNKSKLARKAPTLVNPVKWIQGMDCVTTAAIWEAVKHNVDSKFKKNGGEIGSEAYWNEVTELYDTVIEDTQPMYDELHRSEFQKGGSSFRKFVFPFKTQPMQNMGILANSAVEFVTKKDKASAKKFAKAVSSQATSLLIFSAMTFAAALIRHRADRYKDEDDNITFMSVLPNVMWDMMSNWITTVLPIGGDFIIPAAEDIITSVEKGKISTNKLQSATELSLVNGWFSKLANAGNTLIAQLNGTNKGSVDPWDYAWKVLDVPGTFAELLGVPYSNVSLLLKSVGNYVKDAAKYEGLTNNYGELKTDNITNHIVKAYTSGDRKKGDKLTELWIDQKMSEGKDRDKATDFVEKKLIAGVADMEQAKQAAIAEYSGNYNEAERLKAEVMKMGISENVVEKAVDQVVKNIFADLKDKHVEDEGTAAERFKEEGFSGSGAKDAAAKYIKSISESDSGEKAAYTTADAFNALKNGETESYDAIREYLIKRKVESGKSEKEAAKSVDTAVKSLTRTKSLFDDYHSVSGEKFYRAKEQLERIYGKDLEKKYKEYLKKYVNK